MTSLQHESIAEIIATSPEQREQFVARFGTAEYVQLLEFLWEFWGRPSQFAPEGDWSTWLILAGRGFGKTRTGAEWVRANMCGGTPLAPGRWRHIALIAETAADARDVMVGDGKAVSDPKAGSGLLQIHSKDFRPTYEPSKRRLTWPNGAVASIYNGTEPDQLRGPQHDAAWCDELAKWQYAKEAWDQLQFGLRTGRNPQFCITSTPRPIGLLKDIIKGPSTVVTGGSTIEAICRQSSCRSFSANTRAHGLAGRSFMPTYWRTWRGRCGSALSSMRFG
jgi:phage terminase large subunit-like protein